MAPTILLADESPHARRMGCIYLEDLGCRVVAVADGGAALEALERDLPDLVLAAATLPGISGLELGRLAKERAGARKLPVLILVGGLARAELSDWPGADGVLRKPLSSAGLEAWLPTAQDADASAAEEAVPPPAVLSPAAMLIESVRHAADPARRA